ncbi:MAG: 5'-nucleotidase C-terminal domain-containing protein [Cellulosilyticaceae bacterium]
MKKVKLSILIFTLLVCSVFPIFGADQTKVTIIHTNDTHARIVDDGKAIGFAKMAAYVEELKKENNVVVLDGGDMFQGLPIANLEKGQNIVSVINQVGYDAMAPGNHEYDFGSENLAELYKKLNFPMLSANIATTEGKEVFKPYIVKEFEGVKVGIFGLTTPETYYKTHPNNVKGYEFQDIVKSAEKAVKALKETEKVDVVVMVSHLGLDEGTDTSDIVAKQVKGIDVIVDGHSHTTLPEGRLVNDTMIVSTGEYFANLGRVDLTIENGKVVNKEVKLLSYADLAEVTPNALIAEEISKLDKAFTAVLGQVIGKTSVVLDGERETARTGETNLGQLTTNAMLKESGADMAITNGGGIRASIPVGDITMGHISTVFPFGNTLMVKEIKGSDIVAALEYGVGDYPEQKGAFPHTAGITFTLHAKEAVGNRISNVKIAGENLDPNKLYTVVTNDFMAAGGDGYTMFKEYPIKAEYNTLMDVLLGYIKELGVIDIQKETRMTITNESNGVKEEVAVAKVVKLRDYAEQKAFKVVYDAKTKEITMTKENLVIVTKVGSANYTMINNGVTTTGTFVTPLELKEEATYFDGAELEALIKEVA